MRSRSVYSVFLINVHVSANTASCFVAEGMDWELISGCIVVCPFLCLCFPFGGPRRRVCSIIIVHVMLAPLNSVSTTTSADDIFRIVELGNSECLVFLCRNPWFFVSLGVLSNFPSLLGPISNSWQAISSNNKSMRGKNLRTWSWHTQQITYRRSTCCKQKKEKEVQTTWWVSQLR